MTSRGMVSGSKALPLTLNGYGVVWSSTGFFPLANLRTRRQIHRGSNMQFCQMHCVRPPVESGRWDDFGGHAPNHHIPPPKDLED